MGVCVSVCRPKWNRKCEVQSTEHIRIRSEYVCESCECISLHNSILKCAERRTKRVEIVIVYYESTNNNTTTHLATVIRQDHIHLSILYHIMVKACGHTPCARSRTGRTWLCVCVHECTADDVESIGTISFAVHIQHLNAMWEYVWSLMGTVYWFLPTAEREIQSIWHILLLFSNFLL